MTKFLGVEEAQAAVRANVSPRYVELENLERYADCTQYDGRPDWFKAEDTPRYERKPCIVYPIVQAAIESNVDLVLGESRFPHFSTFANEDDTDFDTDALSKEDSTHLDRFIKELEKVTRFRTVSREVFRHAQACRSAAAIFSVRMGRICIDTVKAKWCTPSFDSSGDVSKLVIEYPYLVSEKQSDGTYRTTCMVYRREIDAARDVTMLPAVASPEGTPIAWREDPSKTFVHGLGFCPVVWYPHMKSCDVVGNFDGRAMHEHCLDEIFAHDLALSQRHTAALFCGDPQLAEIGVEAGYNPSSVGRKASIPATPRGGAPTASTGNPVTGQYQSTAPEAARKKGVSIAWQYPSPDSKVMLLTLPPEALKAIDDHARDLRIKICESLSVVFMDSDTVKYATSLSGKAMQALQQRQINSCEGKRDDLMHAWFTPALGMCLRLCLTVPGLRIAGIGKAIAILRKHNGAEPWRMPSLTAQWGAWYSPDPEDEDKTVTMVAKARDAGVVSLRAAIEKLRGIFPVQSTEAAMGSIACESDPARLAEALTAADLAGLESATFTLEARKNLARAILVGAPPEVLANVDKELAAAPKESSKTPEAPGPVAPSAKPSDPEMSSLDEDDDEPAAGDIVEAA